MATLNQEPTPTTCNGQLALSALQCLWSSYFYSPTPTDSRPTLTAPSTTSTRTILYLAYGSNLSAETFRGNRGIKPLSSTNVHVPSLDLTFDLAGIPYTEPCFANSQYRDPSNSTKNHYHKNLWKKGLVGVVYEVTPSDYRTIIATEGGGASYQDVVVDCFVLPKGTKTINPNPTTAAFKAHTLLCPRQTSTSPPNRIQRPDPCYAQPSARYLKLITDGAEEHSLPDEYLAYLYNIRAYTMTTYRQRIGQALIVAFWGPIIMFLFGLGKVFADEDGKIPGWLSGIIGFFFRLMWLVYDGGFEKVFGDGERTIKEKEGEGDEEKGCGKWWGEWRVRLGEKGDGK